MDKHYQNNLHSQETRASNKTNMSWSTRKVVRTQGFSGTSFGEIEEEKAELVVGVPL